MKFTKILVVLLALCLLLSSMVACDNGRSSKKDKEDREQQSETVNKFEQFEKGLTEANISFEVNSKAATMVGAKEGYGYIFSDGTAVEVYLFDVFSDAYKEATKKNQLTVQSFGTTLDVVFNGDICIYFNDEIANKETIMNIFYSIK